VSEIHVLTTSDQQAKQVVRNIESALMAQLGLKIDHRKISVAQTADVRPIEQMQEAGGTAPDPRSGWWSSRGSRCGPRSGRSA